MTRIFQKSTLWQNYGNKKDFVNFLNLFTIEYNDLLSTFINYFFKGVGLNFHILYKIFWNPTRYCEKWLTDWFSSAEDRRRHDGDGPVPNRPTARMRTAPYPDSANRHAARRRPGSHGDRPAVTSPPRAVDQDLAAETGRPATRSGGPHCQGLQAAFTNPIRAGLGKRSDIGGASTLNDGVEP